MNMLEIVTKKSVSEASAPNANAVVIPRPVLASSLEELQTRGVSLARAHDLTPDYERLNTHNRHIVGRLFAAIHGFQIENSYQAIRDDYHVADGEDKRVHDNNSGKMWTVIRCARGIDIDVQETHNCQGYQINVYGAVEESLKRQSFLIRASNVDALIRENLELPNIPINRAQYFLDQKQATLDELKGVNIRLIASQFCDMASGETAFKSQSDVHKNMRASISLGMQNAYTPQGASALQCAADIRDCARIAAHADVLYNRLDEIVDIAIKSRIRDSRRLLDFYLNEAQKKQKGIGTRVHLWIYRKLLAKLSADQLPKHVKIVIGAAGSSANKIAIANKACDLLGLKQPLGFNPLK